MTSLNILKHLHPLLPEFDPDFRFSRPVSQKTRAVKTLFGDFPRYSKTVKKHAPPSPFLSTPKVPKADPVTPSFGSFGKTPNYSVKKAPG